MANEIEIKLKWENEDSFEMTLKEDNGETLSVIRVEENGTLASLWGNVAEICISSFTKHIKIIGDEMSS